MTLSPFNGPRGRAPAAEQKSEALHRVISILLQGIALHGFQFEAGAFEKFQTGIRKVRSDFDEAADEDTALLLAGSAIRLMEDHGSSAERFLQSRKTESEAVIGLLSGTLCGLSSVDPQIGIRLREAERDFASAGRPEDMTAARSRMADCLEALRESLRRPAGSRAPTPGENDGVTGLPDSGYAESAFTAVWGRRTEFFAAIFALERLEAINLRFGFKAGDELLLILSQHVAQNIRAGDNLFRWRGPCLVALIERQTHEALITSELSRIASTRLEHAIRMKDREVMVPVSMSFELLPLSASASVDELVSNLNDFAANRTRQLR